VVDVYGGSGCSNNPACCVFTDYGCDSINVHVGGGGCEQVCVGEGDGNECDGISVAVVGFNCCGCWFASEYGGTSGDGSCDGVAGVDGVERDLV
jgi:hypothetical protein